MALTLGQAAKTYKVAKGTLSKALTGGALSGEKDENGRWQIEPAELDRWVSTHRSRKQDENHNSTPALNAETPRGNSDLESEVEALRQALDKEQGERERERSQLTDRIADLTTRLDDESSERRKLTAMITDQRERPRKGLWARLTG